MPCYICKEYFRPGDKTIEWDGEDGKSFSVHAGCWIPGADNGFPCKVRAVDALLMLDYEDPLERFVEGWIC